MTKRFSILRAKLQELESKLHDALLLHPPESDHQHQHQNHNQTHHANNLSEDIKQKFGFIKNLLSAEISSSPPSKPHHLQHVAHRIASLEEAFLKWDTSSCSCTDSCFHDDGEATGEVGVAVADFAETEDFPEGFKAMVEPQGEKQETSLPLWLLF